MNNTQEVLNVKVWLFFYWAIITTRLKAINPTFYRTVGRQSVTYKPYCY